MSPVFSRLPDQNLIEYYLAKGSLGFYIIELQLDWVVVWTNVQRDAFWRKIIKSREIFHGGILVVNKHTYILIDLFFQWGDPSAWL